MRTLILIFIGGGLGSLLRYLISKVSNNNLNFPIGTFVVNVLACLILGFVAGVATNDTKSENNLTAFWVIGFCGGFSTFSAFAFQNLQMIQGNLNLSAIIYSLASIVFCVLACWTGLYISKLLF